MRIQFINEHGIEEAGVDGGGLFKDFMENLVKEGFNPNIGLFKATEDNRLYPSPAATQVSRLAKRCSTALMLYCITSYCVMCCTAMLHSLALAGL